MKPLLIQYSNEKVVDGQKVSFGIQAEVEAEESYESAVYALKQRVDSELSTILPNVEKEKLKFAREKLNSLQAELKNLLDTQESEKEEPVEEVVEDVTILSANSDNSTVELDSNKTLLESLRKAQEAGLLKEFLGGNISTQEIDYARLAKSVLEQKAKEDSESNKEENKNSEEPNPEELN